MSTPRVNVDWESANQDITFSNGLRARLYDSEILFNLSVTERPSIVEVGVRSDDMSDPLYHIWPKQGHLQVLFEKDHRYLELLRYSFDGELQVKCPLTGLSAILYRDPRE